MPYTNVEFQSWTFATNPLLGQITQFLYNHEISQAQAGKLIISSSSAPFHIHTNTTLRNAIRNNPTLTLL